MSALTEGFRKRWDVELIPNVLRGLSASVYTQVSDIEEELNGLLTYDRKLLKVNAEKVREMNRKLAEAFAGAVSWKVNGPGSAHRKRGHPHLPAAGADIQTRTAGL